MVLQDYIPVLYKHQGKELLDWEKLKPLFKIIQRLAEDRNRLTHKGEMPARALENLPETLATVSDLLYILDVLEGHEWAKGNVQERTRQLLGWPKPRHARFFCKVQVLAG
jgi:hypothetical protein